MVSANYEKSLYQFFKHFSLGLCVVEFYFYDDTTDILQFMLFLISAQSWNMKVLILLLGGCI